MTVEGVYTVIDNRHEPGKLAIKFAWYTSFQAESWAHQLRELLNCSLDAIEVVYLPIGKDTDPPS